MKPQITCDGCGEQILVSMPRIRIQWQIAGDITKQFLRRQGLDDPPELARTEGAYHEDCWRELQARMMDIEL